MELGATPCRNFISSSITDFRPFRGMYVMLARASDLLTFHLWYPLYKESRVKHEAYNPDAVFFVLNDGSCHCFYYKYFFQHWCLFSNYYSVLQLLNTQMYQVLYKAGHFRWPLFTEFQINILRSGPPLLYFCIQCLLNM